MAILYHTAPLSRAKSLLRNGILPACSKGAREESWLHTPGRLDWARKHMQDRHGAAKVVSLRVSVDRKLLTRRRRGIWTCSQPIGPEQIQAVNIVAMI